MSNMSMTRLPKAVLPAKPRKTAWVKWPPSKSQSGRPCAPLRVQGSRAGRFPRSPWRCATARAPPRGRGSAGRTAGPGSRLGSRRTRMIPQRCVPYCLRASPAPAGLSAADEALREIIVEYIKSATRSCSRALRTPTTSRSRREVGRRRGGWDATEVILRDHWPLPWSSRLCLPCFRPPPPTRSRGLAAPRHEGGLLYSAARALKDRNAQLSRRRPSCKIWTRYSFLLAQGRDSASLRAGETQSNHRLARFVRYTLAVRMHEHYDISAQTGRTARAFPVHPTPEQFLP